MYITGKGRSGSTMLAGLLGGLTGTVNVGELWHLWRGLEERRICGCGASLSECPFWIGVLRRLSEADVDPEEMRVLQKKVLSWQGLVRMPEPLTRRARRRWAIQMAVVYRAISAAANGATVVDASKWPLDPVITTDLRPHAVDVAAIHLIRDPRAVAFSWERKKEIVDNSDAQVMPTHSPVASALSWIVRNSLIELASVSGMARPTRVRYEDLCADPPRVLTRIARLVAPQSTPLSKVPSIETQHTVAGNPDRFRRGILNVELDNEWEVNLSYSKRLLVDAITFPLLIAYRYPLRNIRTQPLANSSRPA